MSEKTIRSNCRFAVQQPEQGKAVLVVTLYQEIPALKNAVLGFDLLGGVNPEAARKLADEMNDLVLNLFVTVKEP